jgi:hypothetical protein
MNDRKHFADIHWGFLAFGELMEGRMVAGGDRGVMSLPDKLEEDLQSGLRTPSSQKPTEVQVQVTQPPSPPPNFDESIRSSFSMCAMESPFKVPHKW